MSPYMDFNNDGVGDFAESTLVSVYSWPANVDPVEYEKSGAQDAPHITDPQGQKMPGDMVPANEIKVGWKDSRIPDNVSAWYVTPFIYHRGWQNPAIRFFNDDRSMSFVPGDKVALRRSDTAVTTAMVEGVVILYDYKNKQRWGTIYLDFGEDPKNQPAAGKRFVSINDVVWTTAQGPLDMKRAVKLATDGVSPQQASQPENEMAGLLQDAKRKVTSLSENGMIEKRNVVLDLVKDYPYRKEIPSGWENSVLFVLGLNPSYLDSKKNSQKTVLRGQ